MTPRGEVERTLSWRRVAFSGARVLTALLLLMGFVSAVHGQEARSPFGVVSRVDEVGKAIQLSTPPSSMNPRRESFLVTQAIGLAPSRSGGQDRDVLPAPPCRSARTR